MPASAPQPRPSLLGAFSVLGATLVLGLVVLATGRTIPAANPHRLLHPYTHLPLSFEPNRGQTDPQVKFLSRGPGYTVFLTPTDAVVALRSHGSDPAVLRVRLLGANSAASITGLAELPGKSNYFIGNRPTRWHTNVPHYARVRYRDIYPGIDLIYYGNPPDLSQLEYDFVVAPGADPTGIRLAVEGADKLEFNPAGDLVLSTPGGSLLFQRPVVYQQVAGSRRQIAAGFRVESRVSDGQPPVIAFDLGRYDPGKPLIIDPVILRYSTYLGGASDDFALDLALDASGNAYLTGLTQSANFPTASPVQTNLGGGTDVFVAKFNAGGSALLYSTYLGGSGADIGRGIAVDAAGNAYLTGATDSTNFPTTSGAFQTARGGPSAQAIADAFVTKLDPSGSALAYSTYLGAAGTDVGRGIAVEAAGSAYVTGETTSSNFPTAGAFQGGLAGSADAFVVKLNPAGSALVYSTYLGGSGGEAGRSVAVDATGSAYVVGDTSSTNFPTASPFQAAFGALRDAFVTKFTPAGSALVYSTYLGGTGVENRFGAGIALDASGNAYVSGSTDSPNFPLASPFQANLAGLTDAYVAKLNPAGSALVYSTYLGGSGDDDGFDIALDSAGNAHLIGVTQSTDFPILSSVQAGLSGPSDAYVTKFNAAGSALLYSTYLGGGGSEQGNAIGVDTAGNAYVSGATDSPDFPLVTPFQSALRGANDVFLAKLEVPPATNPIPLLTSISPASVTAGGPGFTLTVTGTNFIASSVVRWNGSDRTTNFVSSTQLTAFIAASDIARGGYYEVTVFTPPPRGGTSNVRNLVVADFTLQVSPAGTSRKPGESATYTVFIFPRNGPFNSPILLTCPPPLPPNFSCSFSPRTLTPGANDATSILTVFTGGGSALLTPPLRPLEPTRLPAFGLVGIAAGFGVAGLVIVSRRRLMRRLALIFLLGVVVFQAACGRVTRSAASPTGKFTITVKAASGSFRVTTTTELILE